MAVYLILMGIVLILAYPLIERKPSVRKKLCYVIVTFGAMLLISVLRYGLGNDYYSYVYIFRQISDASWLGMFNTGYEPGFVIIDKLISCISTNVDFMFAIHAILIMSAVAYVVFRHSENIWLSTVMFISLTFFYCSLSFIRQAYAFALILLAYRFFKERNHFMVMLFIFLACLFHSTVIIMIPIYLISVFVKPTKLTIAIYGGVTLLIYLFSWQILDIAVKILPQYKNYLNLNFIQTGFKPVYLIVPTVIMLIALFAHFTGYGKAYPKESSLFTNFAIFNFVIWLMSTKHFVIERFSMYVYIFMIMFIPSIVTYYRKRLHVYWYDKKHARAAADDTLDENTDADAENEMILAQIMSETDEADSVSTPALAFDGPKFDCTVDEYYSAKKKSIKSQEQSEPEQEEELETDEELQEKEKILSELLEDDEKSEKKLHKNDKYVADENYYPEKFKYKKPKNKFLQWVTNPIAAFSTILAITLGFCLWYNYFGLTVSSKGFHGVVPYRSIVPLYTELTLKGEKSSDKNALLNKETNFISYLYRLKESNHYTVIISGRGDCVSGLNDTARASLKMLGLEKLVNEADANDNYIAIISNGEVIYEECSKTQLEYSTSIQGFKTKIVSGRKISTIQMGKKDFSKNERGLNFVVMDNRHRTIIDKVRFKAYYVMLSATR